MGRRTNLKRLKKTGEVSVIEVIKKNASNDAKYEIQDPSERLIATLGTSMMNEPKYYPADAGSTVGYKYDSSDFDESAQMIINTAMEIAQSDSPRDLLAIAAWARKDMKMRTTPQILLAVAAECTETKKFVREYAPKIIQRADELKQTFIGYRSLFGTSKSLPNSLKRGLADAFTKFREQDFLKYEGHSRPTFADVLKMIDRRKDYPLSKALDKYLKDGTVIDEKETPIIAARKKLAKCTEFDGDAKALAAKSRANWEVVVSQFGNKKEVWEHLIDTEQLGYMATLRNLRNMLQADISEDHVTTVCQKLERGATKSKQLPFRFLSAKAMLEAEGALKNVQKVIASLEKAVNNIIEDLPKIPGRSLIAVDTSGSMETPVSVNSKMTLANAASILGAILYKMSEEGSVLGPFANKFKPVQGIKGMGPLEIAERVGQIGKVGHGTNAADVIRFAMQSGKYDRIVIFSDMQTYGTGTGWYGGDSGINEHLKEYRAKKNEKCYLHSFDLAGYGNSVTEQGDTLTNIVGGYSDKLLDTILQFEGLANSDGTVRKEGEEQVFTLEYIRKNF